MPKLAPSLLADPQPWTAALRVLRRRGNNFHRVPHDIRRNRLGITPCFTNNKFSSQLDNKAVAGLHNSVVLHTLTYHKSDRRTQQGVTPTGASMQPEPQASPTCPVLRLPDE